MDIKEMKRMDEEVKKITGYDPDELLGFDREALDRIFKNINNEIWIKEQ